LQQLKKTKKFSKEKLSHVSITIYDSPPGTSCPVIESVKDADIVILVTEPTPFGLHDLKLTVETLRELHKPFGIIVNRHGIGNDEVIHYCQNEQIPILAKIPNSRQIAELYSSGKLIYREIPEVKMALDNILEYCLKAAERQVQ
jgi:MinD superfamily P-loop ATPase